MSIPCRSEPFPQLYFCCDERRRDSVRGTALNGIDYLEVVDHDARQTPIVSGSCASISSTISRPVASRGNVSISGGERIRPIVILDATIGAGDDADVLTVEVEQPGDFSIYTLRLVRRPNDPAPPAGIDPRLACDRFFIQGRMPVGFRLRAEARFVRRLRDPSPRSIISRRITPAFVS